MELEVSARLVEAYRIFIDAVKPKIDTAYYPGCGVDTSASKVFNRIIYVDKKPEIVQLLKQGGLEAHCEDATEFTLPESTDAVILQNPGHDISTPLTNLREGGYALCNDYHESATKVRERADFSLLGVSVFDGKKIVFDRENLDDYWKQVETEEEFRVIPVSFGFVMSYQRAVDLVKALAGKTDNILATYIELREEAIREQKEFRAELIEEFPEAEKLDTGPPTTTIGETTYMFLPLPPKKGTVDDLFAFKHMA